MYDYSLYYILLMITYFKYICLEFFYLNSSKVLVLDLCNA